MNTIVCVGQKTDAFARVQVTPREGLVRQAYKVTIHVHSSTWFAKPLEFQNLRIENAFIIPFTRTQSGIDYINNKKYATLSFYYLVFPYKSGPLEIPSLNIVASIPPEGDYKGIPVTIKTKVQNIKVNNTEDGTWMVAKNITIQDNWNKSLDNLKVGDVVKRTITTKAFGTLPSLIAPLALDEPNNTSIYPAEAKLQDKRTNADVNGIRIEEFSYLFEKEGEVSIPETEITWINPINKRTYKRSIPERLVNIKANPDLAMMESLKDSLMAMSPNTNIEATTEDNVTDWKKTLIISVLSLLILWYGIKYGTKLYKIQKEIKSEYLVSEPFYYKELQRTLSKKNRTEFINALYRWYDVANNGVMSPAINTILNKKQNAVLLQLIMSKADSLNHEEVKTAKNLCLQIRQSILKPASNKLSSSSLNP